MSIPLAQDADSQPVSPKRIHRFLRRPVLPPGLDILHRFPNLLSDDRRPPEGFRSRLLSRPDRAGRLQEAEEQPTAA